MTWRGSRWMWIAVIALLPGCGLHGKPKIARSEGAATGALAHSAARPAPPPPAAVATEQLDPGMVVSPGIVEPWGGQVDLSAQEPGWIARIAAAEGEAVQAGQLLATLEDAAQRQALELARAELEEAEAALTKIERGATPEEVLQAKAESAAASARGRLARSAVARTTRLHQQGAVPDSEADAATAEAQAQTALAERAEARVREITRGARAEDRSAAQARLRLAEANLARRRIVAPSAGTVLLSRFHPGEFYGVGAGPLFVLGDMTRLQVRLEVDEIDAPAIDRAARSVLYSDGGVALAEGTVLRLAPKMGRRALAIESPTARSDVRVREVFIEIPATANLVPGQRVWGHTARATGPLALRETLPKP